MINPQNNDTVGFGLSPKGSVTIESGGTGEGSTPVDLGANYAFLTVRIVDCSGIPSGATIVFDVAPDTDESMCRLYDDGVEYSITLPSSGSFQQLIRVSMPARRVRPTLSANVTSDTEIGFYGSDLQIS